MIDSEKKYQHVSAINDHGEITVPIPYPYKHSVMPDIIHEDDEIIVVNKPAGMLAQKDSTGRVSLACIVADYLKSRVSADDSVYCAPLHRLDLPVSGVMMFAKNIRAAGTLSVELKERKMRRFYCAVVNDEPTVPSACCWTDLNQYYIRRRDRAYITDENNPGAISVSLRYRYLRIGCIRYPVLVELITGKRHQIRVQLSSMGSPVAGDVFYGSKETAADGVIFLHAHYLCFNHPRTRCPIIVSAPLPQYFTDRISIIPDINDYLSE